MPISAPLRPVRLGALDAVLERRAGGIIHIRTAQVLGDYHGKLTEPLEHWAKAAPDRVFLAQRDAAGEWRKLTYAQVLSDVKRIGAALLRRGLSPERPIAIMSGNDIEHAMLALAAMYVGIPYAPISPAYSLMSSDFGKLRAIIDLLTPGMVFANDGGAFARAHCGDRAARHRTGGDAQSAAPTARPRCSPISPPARTRPASTPRMRR